MSEFTFNLKELTEVNQLLDLPDDQLYEMLAPDNQMYALPGEKLWAGKDYLNGILAKAKTAICGNETIHLLAANPKIKDGTDVILAISAVIKATVAASPYLLAGVLAFRFGLQRICRHEWTETGK